MANPRVNVLIANYNYEEYIVDAIESAINQSYPDITITIVDDGSTDSSYIKVFEKYFIGDYQQILPSKFDSKRCIYIRNGKVIPISLIKLDKNYGPSFARNIGIETSLNETDYYMILDADDIMYKNKVLRCVQTAMKLPHINAIVYSDYMTFNIENQLSRIEYKENFDIERLYRDCIIHSGSLILKDALVAANDEFGYYDSEMRVCEDYDLWLRIIERYSAVHIPECLTIVRVTPKNSTNQVDNTVRQQCLSKIQYKINRRKSV